MIYRTLRFLFELFLQSIESCLFLCFRLQLLNCSWICDRVQFRLGVFSKFISVEKSWKNLKLASTNILRFLSTFRIIHSASYTAAIFHEQKPNRFDYKHFFSNPVVVDKGLKAIAINIIDFSMNIVVCYQNCWIHSQRHPMNCLESLIKPSQAKTLRRR